MKKVIKDLCNATIVIIGFLLIIGAVGKFENGNCSFKEMILYIGAGALITFIGWQEVKR